MKIIVEFEFPKDLNDHISDEFIFGNTLKSIPFSDVSMKIINRVKSEELTFDSLEKSVCDFVKRKPEELQLKTRKREVVIARQICHHISKNNNLGSLAEIGYRFGKKDHATVLHSSKTILELLETSRVFRDQYEAFIDSFN